MTQKFAFLWDMDGVLVDTYELHYQSWIEALGEVGIPFDRQTFQSSFGMTAAAVLRSLVKDGTPEFIAQVDSRKEALFRQMLPGQVHPLPGVKEWLQRLKASGHPMAIASSAPMENIDAILDELEMRSYFDSIVSAFYLPSKPDPAVFLEAARQLGYSPQQCIVIEDAVTGVQAAKRAGMKCIAITTTNPAEKLDQADLVIHRLDSLTEELLTLLTSPKIDVQLIQ